MTDNQVVWFCRDCNKSFTEFKCPICNKTAFATGMHNNKCNQDVINCKLSQLVEALRYYAMPEMWVTPLTAIDPEAETLLYDVAQPLRPGWEVAHKALTTAGFKVEE